MHYDGFRSQSSSAQLCALPFDTCPSLSPTLFGRPVSPAHLQVEQVSGARTTDSTASCKAAADLKPQLLPSLCFNVCVCVCLRCYPRVRVSLAGCGTDRFGMSRQIQTFKIDILPSSHASLEHFLSPSTSLVTAALYLLGPRRWGTKDHPRPGYLKNACAQ